MRAFVTAINAALALVSAPALAQERAAVARQSLEQLEARLDRAVDGVSLPHAARLMGRAESARAYRLPGYGVVLVLTPRALPGSAGRVYFLQRGGPKARRVKVDPAPGAGTPETIVWAEDEEGVETFERQVLVLQHETEASRRAAEEEMDRIVRDVRVLVAPPPPGKPTAMTAPPAPAASGAEPPPEAPQAPQPPAAPAPRALAAPAPPPWKFWFETGTPAETRTPEAVIADVRSSVVEALASPVEAFAGLAGEERVTVTVDFVPGGLFAANARPDRTLVVSVRARDVAARLRGAIDVDELRRRVEVDEY